MQLIMPFGKHAGTPVGEVPPGYLIWVLRTCDLKRYPGLRRAIESALADHRANRRARAAAGGDWGTASPGGVDDRVRQGVRHCYRELALAYHPDRRGGDGTAMAAVNHAFDRLRAVLGME